MKRITCFTSNLTGGGAEHQLTILSNLLAEKGYDVTIVTYNNIPDHYVLDKRIKRILLNVDGKNNIIKQLIIHIRLIVSSVIGLCQISYCCSPFL